VTKIEGYAFINCKNLSKVDLPSKLESMGYDIFRNTAISSVTIPKSLTSCSGGTFIGCSKLETVIFEEGITQIPAHLFSSGAGNIKKIAIPNTVTKIGDSAFEQCTSLTEVTIPDTVTNIGTEAFQDCTKLTKAFFNSLNISFGYRVFEKCSNLSIYSPRNSYAAIYAVDNAIPFVEYGNSGLNRTVLKDRNTWFYLKNADKTANISYEIADGYQGITNKKIKIRIPSNITLNESSLRLDGALCQNYTYQDGVLLVPVTQVKGQLDFEFVPQNTEKIYSYALLTYNDGGKNSFEIIDVMGNSFDGITVYADESVTTNSFVVNGIAPKEATVTVYLDGVKQGTVNASKAGSYSYSVRIASPADGKLYEVGVSCECDGKTHEAKTTVEYSDAAPELKEFRLYYNNHSNTSIDLLDDTKKPYVSFNPSVPFTFVTDFDNDDRLSSVYITSTRNNVKRSIEAVYDPNTGKHVANGYFDDSDHRYVPGDLRVEYLLKHEESYIDDEIPDYIDQDLKTVAAAFADSDVTVVRNDQNVKEYTIDLTDTFEKAGKESVETIIDYKVSMYDDKVDGNLGDFLGMTEDTFELMKYVIPGKDGKLYWATADYSDPTTYTMIIKDFTGAANSWYKYQLSFEGDGYWTDSKLFSNLGYIAKGASLANTIAKNQKDYDKRVEEILKSSYIKDKDTALKKNKELLKDQNGYAIMSVALALMPAAIGITGPAAIGFSALMGMIGISSSFFWELRIADIMGKNVGVKWAIDPSGYVYSQVLDNRLEGVKVTALYKEKLTDTTETIWDASEYDQNNPLYTDADGNYAWDVPEGFWKVRAELEGYTTKETDWMEVPPPRTDVAIRMVPSEVPKMLGGFVGMEYVLVVFDQYMDPQTIPGIVLTDKNGSTISYTLDYDKTKTDENGNVYAKEFRLKYSGYTVTDQTEITAKVANTIQSADGISVNADNVKCKNNIDVKIEPSLSLLSGTEATIVYTVTGGTSTFSAKSDAAFIASVEEVKTEDNGNGSITIKGCILGETTIHLLDEMNIERGSVTVKVVGSESELEPTAPVAGITLSATALALRNGGKAELIASIEPIEAIGAPLTWVSTNTSVVTVIGNGIKGTLCAVGEGVAEITVTAKSGVKASCTVEVSQSGDESKNSPMNPVPTIDENTTEIHLVKGQKFTLSESGWTCKDKKTLAVSKKNVVTAKRVTTAPVKLTNGERSIDVYITKPAMAKKSVTMQAGSSQTIEFNFDSEHLPVQWYCNTPDIATVNDEGEVTAVGKGTATITAFVNGSAYNCKVKVKEEVA
ncbi:MAG: leucine-rich repeat protein, partial [Eubacterium sp.]|nr:leucine-rich repeat protein [Eubacterium sp.]